MIKEAPSRVSEIQRFYGLNAWNEWRALLAHFDLSDGFTLLVLLLPGKAGAAICEQTLSEYLRESDKILFRIRCEDEAALARLPQNLIASHPEPNTGGVWIELLTPEPEKSDSWRAACYRSLALLNQQRNRFQRDLPFPIIFVGEPWLQTSFREAAPDLWSVRVSVIRLEPEVPIEPVLPLSSLKENQIELDFDSEAAADPDYALQQANKYRNHPEFAESRANLLIRAGIGFYKQGFPEIAESACRDAWLIYKQLADKNTEKYEPYVAVASLHLAAALSALDRREEALIKNDEALNIYSNLRKENPNKFQAGLAMTQNNQAVLLKDLGRREEALAQAEEAVRTQKQLAQEMPDAFLHHLATSLNNLSNMLSYAGRREDALAPAQEALLIRKQLVKDRPETFLPYLAMSLNSLGNRLSDLGRREEALIQAQEALRIRRQLAKDQPKAFLPKLANSLNSFGIKLIELGRPEEALIHLQEATCIYKQLAQARPQVYLHNLAMALNNLGNLLSDLRRQEEALVKVQEAMHIYEQLANERPDAFLPDLAMSLNNHANVLCTLGRQKEALPQVQEALRIRKQLAKERPDIFLTDLSLSMCLEGECLLKLNRHAEASRIFHQALKFLAPAFQQFPKTFEPLMNSAVHDYHRSIELAHQEPDKVLLFPIMETLQKLKTMKLKN